MTADALNDIARRISQISPETQSLLFRRGFIISTTETSCPDHFHRVSFPLFVALHVDTRYAVVNHNGFYVCIIGVAVDPDNTTADLIDIVDQIVAQPNSFQKIVDRLVGRFVILQGYIETGFNIQTDAIGMRYTFVMPIKGGGYCACSHQNLAAYLFNLPKIPVSYIIKWGSPGIDTRFERLQRLPPNISFNLATGEFTRFFPVRSITPYTAEQAWEYAIDKAKKSLNGFSRHHKLIFSLTAGYDSRTTLCAIEPDLMKQSSYFCYDTGASSTQVDVAISRKIANRLDLDLVQFDARDIPANPDLIEVIALNSVEKHGHLISAAYNHLFGQKNYLHVRTNLLENARANIYSSGRNHWPEGPNTPLAMAQYYKSATRPQPDDVIPIYQASFERYYDICAVGSALEYASAWDIYFIEHRMAAWHGNIVLESDVGFDTVIAFNSRDIIARFWGVPNAERATSNYLKTDVFPRLKEIAEIPINPKNAI